MKKYEVEDLWSNLVLLNDKFILKQEIWRIELKTEMSKTLYTHTRIHTYLFSHALIKKENIALRNKVIPTHLVCV